MAGLLQDSVAEGAAGLSDLGAAAEQDARQQNLNLEKKMGVQEGIGQAVGTVLGKELAKKRAPVDTASTPTDGTSPTGDGSSESAMTPGGASDTGFSMMLGSIGKRLQGGFLKNQAPPMNFKGASGSNIGAGLQEASNPTGISDPALGTLDLTGLYSGSSQ